MVSEPPPNWFLNNNMLRLLLLLLLLFLLYSIVLRKYTSIFLIKKIYRSSICFSWDTTSLVDQRRLAWLVVTDMVIFTPSQKCVFNNNNVQLMSLHDLLNHGCLVLIVTWTVKKYNLFDIPTKTCSHFTFNVHFEH